MARKQEKIWNDPIANTYNGIYHIGLGLCYQITQAFGDSKYSHDFCEYIMNKQKAGETCSTDWDNLCFDFQLNRDRQYYNTNNN